MNKEPERIGVSQEAFNQMDRPASSGYPERPQFFAQRVIRAMTKTAAAQEIGDTAFALVALIACQEDAKRYTGPVTYWNGQLQPLLGIRKWETLAIARTKAVKAGWLRYVEPPKGSRTVPPQYWTLIPVSCDDGPADEGIDVYKAGYQDGYRDGWDAAATTGLPPKNGYRDEDYIRKMEQERIWIGVESGYGLGLKADNFLTLSPKPLALSLEEDCSEPPKAASKPTEPAVLEFPVVGNQGKLWALTQSKIDEYQGSFPGVDVLAECRIARQWCIDNTAKRKTPGGMPQFLSRWLTKEQNRRGGRGESSRQTKQPPRRVEL